MTQQQPRCCKFIFTQYSPRTLPLAVYLHTQHNQRYTYTRETTRPLYFASKTKKKAVEKVCEHALFNRSGVAGTQTRQSPRKTCEIWHTHGAPRWFGPVLLVWRWSCCVGLSGRLAHYPHYSQHGRQPHGVGPSVSSRDAMSDSGACAAP